MKTSRVCLVAHHYYHRHGRLRNFAEALLEAGFEVDVLCLRDPSGQQGGQTPGLTIHTIPLQRKAESSGNPLLEYIVACFLFALWLTGLYLRRHYRLIQVHNMPDFLVYSALIPRLLGARLVLDLADLMPELSMSKYDLPMESKAVRLMLLQERASVWLTHASLTANPLFLSNLLTHGLPAEKLTVVNYIPDGHVFNRARYPRQQRDPAAAYTILYPGTLAPRYGLEVAIRTLPLLVDAIPNVRLVIIGPRNTHTPELEALAASLGVQGYVEFRSLVPLEEIAREMSRADIGIYCGLPDPHMSCATPSKVMEYAYMGLPIVTSRLPILEQFFPDDAVSYCEPGNPNDYAAAILKLYHSPEAAEAQVRTADRAYVEKYNRRSEMQRYYHLLSRMQLYQPQLTAAD